MFNTNIYAQAVAEVLVQREWMRFRDSAEPDGAH